MEIGSSVRQRIHDADRYVRMKDYACLVPGCSKKAVNCPAIPRSFLIEAIAEGKHVYTQPPSFMRVLRMKTPGDAMEVERIGVNNASVFKGYCAEHDRALFAPAEIRNRKWHATPISLHLRSISVEYCRKRAVRDFNAKLAALMKDDPERQAVSLEIARQFGAFMKAFEASYLGAIMALIGGSPIDTVD